MQESFDHHLPLQHIPSINFGVSHLGRQQAFCMLLHLSLLLLNKADEEEFWPNHYLGHSGKPGNDSQAASQTNGSPSK